MKGIDREELHQWQQEYTDSVRQRPERKADFRTRSGIPIKPIYTSADLEGMDEDRDLGLPCDYPYTRGPYPSMYRGQLWTKRLLIGLQIPEIFNERQREMLKQGQTGINLIPCNAYFRGFDSDEVEPELVGRCGTAMDSMQDIEICFDDIPQEQVSTAFNDAGPFIMVAMYIALAQKRGVPLDQLRGTTNQSDFLSHYVACNMMYRFSLEGHLRLLLDHIQFCTQHMPRWQPLSIVGQHMQQGGATPLQSLAFTLASGIFYVEQTIKLGLDVDSFAPRFSFFFDVSLDLFEEIAKFRAARRMWARIMRERFGAKDERSWKLRFHAQTSGTDLTQQQPLNNLIRATVQTLAAVLGGAQSIHTDAYDEALWTPTEESRRLALMTSHIVGEETGVADVIDPLGGSFYVESLTNEMEKQAWDYIGQIDSLGGMMEAVKKGFIQAEITKAALDYQQEVDAGERTVVGVNRYRLPEFADLLPEQEKVPPEMVTRHVERTRRAKTERDQAQAQAAIDLLRRAAEDEGLNTFEAVIEGVKAGLTQGEIVRELRAVYGAGVPLVTV
ncbi:MAG: methylmalonyl-CoA mutase family protein [Dehalococcoidia bacterium]